MLATSKSSSETRGQQLRCNSKAGDKLSLCIHETKACRQKWSCGPSVKPVCVQLAQNVHTLGDHFNMRQKATSHPTGRKTLVMAQQTTSAGLLCGIIFCHYSQAGLSHNEENGLPKPSSVRAKQPVGSTRSMPSSIASWCIAVPSFSTVPAAHQSTSWAYMECRHVSMLVPCMRTAVPMTAGREIGSLKRVDTAS